MNPKKISFYNNNTDNLILDQIIEYNETYNAIKDLPDKILIEEVEEILPYDPPYIPIENIITRYYNSKKVLTKEERKKLLMFYSLFHCEVFLRV